MENLIMSIYELYINLIVYIKNLIVYDQKNYVHEFYF